MDKKQKEELKIVIEKKLGITRRKVEAYRDMAAPVKPENSIGRVSRMDAINNKSVAESALREEEDKLRGLEYMLKNIEEKDFGACSLCGQEIPVPRLLLMPHSPYCVHCAR
jgi:DnaK suppressor protein